jgi:hypothetical protein
MPEIVVSAGTLAVSTEGSALGTMACTEVLIQADPANTGVVFVGGPLAQTIKLSAGVTVTIPVSGLNDIVAKTSAGSATLNWLTHTKSY